MGRARRKGWEHSRREEKRGGEGKRGKEMRRREERDKMITENDKRGVALPVRSEHRIA
jgi:hypothetical protein